MDFIRNDVVRRDWTDLRDQVYQPSLAVLRNRVVPEDWLLPPDLNGRRVPVFGVRDQGRTPYCTGYALAALIDLQRHVQGLRSGDAPPGTTDIVSGDMLYQMGFFHDAELDEEMTYGRFAEQARHAAGGLRSLRSVIKGFYHHGVCRDFPQAGAATPEVWQSCCYLALDAATQVFPTVEQAKSARAIGLGAYYRVRPILNHMHAAINEAGGVLVSADIHEGWTGVFDQTRAPEQTGVIHVPATVQRSGTHAFVVVGYTDQGFLVLNSWGGRWGGYGDLSGIALWRYEDWAERVLDAWVLRLGVSAPKAFRASIGEQGWNRVIGTTRTASAPCYELLGHYMHLDDGLHVQSGSYPSMPDSWVTTRAYLEDVRLKAPESAQPDPADRHYKGMLVWIPGAMEGINPEFGRFTRMKPQIKAQGLYPYTIFWCNSFVEKSLEILTQIFDSCRARVGDDPAELNPAIEASVQGVGRAFWREIETSARRAVRGICETPWDDTTDQHDQSGVLWGFFDDLLELAQTRDTELHLVTDGAGVLVLHEWLRRYVHGVTETPVSHPELVQRKMAELAERITTVQLVLPAICLPRAQKLLLPLIDAVNARWQQEGAGVLPPARILVPDAQTESRLCFGSYGKSLLHLISRSFEDRMPLPDPVTSRVRVQPGNPPRPFLGMGRAAAILGQTATDLTREEEGLAAQEVLTQSGWRTGWGDTVTAAFVTLDGPSDTDYARAPIPQSVFNNHPRVFDAVLSCTSPDAGRQSNTKASDQKKIIWRHDMTRITPEDLITMLGNGDIAEEDLAKYFVLDEEGSTPFGPQFQLNPSTVAIPRGDEAGARSAMALNAANSFCRLRRRQRYYDTLRGGYSGPVVVSEGDSWFQYPFLLKDTIDHVFERYAVYSMGAAGDLLERMERKQEYLRGLQSTGAQILLFSGGGNDLLANGALARHLEAFDPDLRPGDYLLPSFTQLLNSALGQYERILRQVHGSFPQVQVICHGYDYPIPNNGRWLGKPMRERGIRDRGLQAAIAVEMMDQFNRGLRRLARSMGHVTYIDCRGTVGAGRWHDELHPTNEGYKAVADKFIREIRRLSNARATPPVFVSGPFGSATELQSRAMTAPGLAAPDVQTGQNGRMVSLHLGLNAVDPGHYAGWDGALNACENDAHAMQDLATAQGFSTNLLLTRAATRSALVTTVSDLARDLRDGDMFWLSISAHGSQIPDFNHDELDHEDKAMDETLCLYDFQVIDDELYTLWSQFDAGVRILMTPDTCHSGSMARAMPLNVVTFDANGRPVFDMQPGPDAGALTRGMPEPVQRRVNARNAQAYRAYASAFSEMREDIVMNPVTTPLKASVLQLSACQDDQEAMDGDRFGAFTGAMLKVWDQGRFRGDYRGFREQVNLAIDSRDQTPRLFTKLVKDPAFIDQIPFTLWPGTRPSATVHTGTAGGTKMSNAGAVGAPYPMSEPYVTSAHEASGALLTPAAELLADEGEREEDLSDPQIDALFETKAARAAGRSRAAPTDWPDYQDFRAFIAALGLQHFDADEFLVLGGAHNAPDGACGGCNTYPPRDLWPNIANTARVLDRFRARIGLPIAIANAYRAPGYNSCIGGASASQHMRFCAIDFVVHGMAPSDVAMALRWMRDEEGLFAGGIGRYKSFVHIDTRGVNTTWPLDFREAPVVNGIPRADVPQGRLARLREMKLAPAKRGLPEGETAFAQGVPRGRDAFDAGGALLLKQQEIRAAVSASSVISFVDNLTPGQKEDVLCSTLFAQRAADARHDPVAERSEWFAVYMDTLALLGWARESAPFEAHEKLRGDGRFDQAVLATLAAIATGNQMKIVTSAIEALRGLAEDDGRIALFNFSTTTTKGGNFQIGAAEASGDVVTLAMGAFNFEHKDAKRNILFVSWGSEELKFWLAAQKLTLSADQYGQVRDLIRERLGTTRKSLIADIPLV